jgi:light-regulated signal transduction histidine kinase (bacteriophytochrome)
MTTDSPPGDNPFAVPPEVLARCDEEAIETPEAIQSFGALLVVDACTGRVLRGSANLNTWLHIDVHALPGQPVETCLTTTDGEPLQAVFAAMTPGRSLAMHVQARRAPAESPPLHALIHRDGDHALIDLERLVPQSGASMALLGAIDELRAVDAVEDLGALLTGHIRRLTGYDRVMLYRFDEHWHGEVVAEAAHPDVGSFLGMRFPDTDIPPRARRLYTARRVRLLADRDSPSISLVGSSGEPTDLSMSALRAVSPVHLEYLYNMGVRGTLVLSVLVGGRLWGLVACHHHQPLCIDPELRFRVETLVTLASARIEDLTRLRTSELTLQLRTLLEPEDHTPRDMVQALPWQHRVFERLAPHLASLGVQGMAWLQKSRPLRCGQVPPLRGLQALHAWYREQRNEGRPRMLATDHLAGWQPEWGRWCGEVAGALLIPACASRDDVLCLFRHERVRSVTWAGIPTKTLREVDGQVRLSPRLSFERWESMQVQHADPWTDTDLAIADVLREALWRLDALQQERDRQASELALVRSQQELALAEARIREMMDGTPDALLSLDPAGRILASNRAAAQLFAQLAGHPLQPDRALPDQVPRPARAPLREALRQLFTDDGGRWEWKVTNHQGLQRTLVVKAQPGALRPATEAPALPARTVSVRDETEARHAAARERRLEQQVLHAQHQQSLAALAGGIAHDFNNLLVGIRCNAEFVRDHETLTTDSAEAVQDMLEAARVASDLTRQMLAYAGRGQTRRQRLEVGDIVRGLAPLVRVGPRRSPIHVQPGPELSLEADPTQLRQLVLNLLTNAVEALGEEPSGRVTIGWEAVPQVSIERLQAAAFHATWQPGPMAALVVRDTGHGMDPDTRRRMFEPFFSTRFAGRGLGMAAVAGVVRVHRGAIEVESAPGRGTRITVLLPLEAAPGPAAEAASGTDPATAVLVGLDPRDHPGLVAVLEAAGLTLSPHEDIRSWLTCARTLQPHTRVVVVHGADEVWSAGGTMAATLRQQHPDALLLAWMGALPVPPRDAPAHEGLLTVGGDALQELGAMLERFLQHSLAPLPGAHAPL